MKPWLAWCRPARPSPSPAWARGSSPCVIFAPTARQGCPMAMWMMSASNVRCTKALWISAPAPPCLPPSPKPPGPTQHAWRRAWSKSRCVDRSAAIQLHSFVKRATLGQPRVPPQSSAHEPEFLHGGAGGWAGATPGREPAAPRLKAGRKWPRQHAGRVAAWQGMTRSGKTDRAGRPVGRLLRVVLPPAGWQRGSSPCPRPSPGRPRSPHPRHSRRG